jgi:cytochrome c biogenesis protein
MRFAVSLLMFICVASLVGTVLPQGRPSSNYIDQFGPFWYAVFDKFSIWHVYNSWWFLLIMAFLVVSTGVCLVRNTPRMIHEARSFREHVRMSSLRVFTHRVETTHPAAPAQSTEAVSQLLKGMGYSVRLSPRDDGVMVAAKKGSVNRVGYIFAHAAMVIICVGGLFDSELPVRLQIWLGNKQPITENMLISQVPDSGRLSVDNPSFRASVLVAEGGQAASAVVMTGDGALVQPMPFTLKLNKFIVDYYSTGMPSRFASEVEVTDPDTGKSFDTTIQVNEPLHFKGMTVYQSSFDDGGSQVELLGYPLTGGDLPQFKVSGTVGKQSAFSAATPAGEKAMQVDITTLRPINVEDMSGGVPKENNNSFRQDVAAVTGSAGGKKNENLKNVGPSVEYRLVDEAGQSHEFQNYMLPVPLDGSQVFLAGVRNNSNEPYRYLRIPADADDSVAEFMHLRAVLADPAARQEAARRFAQRNGLEGDERDAVAATTQRTLDTLATEGLSGVDAFLRAKVPEADRDKAATVLLRLLGAGMNELRGIERERYKLPPLPTGGADAEQAADWSRLALAALSDLNVYPAPVFFSLSSFKHVQASVFQVSRTPGKAIVYLGCLLLILGVFSMFYIRDRRIWVWIKPDAANTGSDLLAAMTSQKRTLDFTREFERFREALLRLGKF